MRLQLVGFFRELSHGGPQGGSLRDAVRPTPHPDQERIAAYLEAGSVLAMAFGPTVDALDPARPKMKGLQLLTDGVREWPNDLAYFVRRYNVEVPADFVEEMRARNWTPPTLTKPELIALSVAQQAEMGLK